MARHTERNRCLLPVWLWGPHIFSGKYIYVGSRKDGSPVSNDGFEVTKEEACIMARLFRGYVSVKRELKEEWDQLSEQGQIKIKSMLGEKRNHRLKSSYIR